MTFYVAGSGLEFPILPPLPSPVLDICNTMPCLPQLLALSTILIYSHITQGLPDPLEFLSVRKEMTIGLFLFLFWHLNGAVPSIVWPFLCVNANLGNWTLIHIRRGGSQPSSISRICWVLAGVKAQPCRWAVALCRGYGQYRNSFTKNQFVLLRGRMFQSNSHTLDH